MDICETRRCAIRRLLQVGAAIGSTILSAGCAVEHGWAAPPVAALGVFLSSQAAGAAQLQSRPQVSTPTEAGDAGLRPLGLDDARDALLYVPTGYEAPAPLVLSLHGAGGDAQGGLYPLQPLADDGGFLVLSVPSRGLTWDAVRGGFGPDVTFVDQALAWTFERYVAQPAYIAVAGFSDGASYALSLGLANGDLFRQVMAFSPGFVAAAPPRGRPRIFVSHGTVDSVLPIDQCSRRIVPRLREAEYEVTYQEFDGPHTVPPQIAHTAATWFLTDRTVPPSPATSPADDGIAREVYGDA
jgi:phospholipase/carboxylesterase